MREQSLRGLLGRRTSRRADCRNKASGLPRREGLHMRWDLPSDLGDDTKHLCQRPRRDGTVGTGKHPEKVA